LDLQIGGRAVIQTLDQSPNVCGKSVPYSLRKPTGLQRDGIHPAGKLKSNLRVVDRPIEVAAVLGVAASRQRTSNGASIVTRLQFPTELYQRQLSPRTVNHVHRLFASSTEPSRRLGIAQEEDISLAKR